MTLALDTDILVNWLVRGTAFHRRARRLVETEVKRRGGTLGIAPQTLHEFLHITTDPKRLERPFSMAQAVALTRELWDAKEVVRIMPTAAVLHRTLELLSTLSLGRKRMLDTALAATLEAAGVRRLATFNADDFKIFPFLEVVEPR